jgi:hypothetical protein
MWVEADVKGTEVFTTQRTIIYRLPGVEVSECEGLTALMKVVDEGSIGDLDDFEEHALKGDIDSDGWTESSVFSYLYDQAEDEPDIPAEEQEDLSGDKDCVDTDNEVVPSSQGSSDFL